MQHGPVLSETLDLINYGSSPSEESYWTPEESEQIIGDLRAMGAAEAIFG